MIGGCRGKHHWDFPSAVFFPPPSFYKGGGGVSRGERETLCKSCIATLLRHTERLSKNQKNTTKSQDSFKAAAHSVRKPTCGRRHFEL